MLPSRFFDKVAGSNPGDCHLWTAAKNAKGYGRYGFGGKNQYAHRLMWESVNGPVPPGLIVMHSCDNPACVNLRHLRLGTHGDNARDKMAKNRQQRLRGAANGRAKLTEEQVRAILGSSLTNTQLGRIYGINPVSVAYIRKGRNWSHVAT